MGAHLVERFQSETCDRPGDPAFADPVATADLGIVGQGGDGGSWIERDATGSEALAENEPFAHVADIDAALQEIGLGQSGAREIDDVTTCPGAYSCNLALTKAMNLGAALQEVVRDYSDPLVRKLTIKVSGCPNSCGQHWISDLGFYGNARKIDGKEIPYYQMLLGGGYDDDHVMRFGLAVQSIPARLAPEAVKRVLDHIDVTSSLMSEAGIAGFE